MYDRFHIYAVMAGNILWHVYFCVLQEMRWGAKKNIQIWRSAGRVCSKFHFNALMTIHPHVAVLCPIFDRNYLMSGISPTGQYLHRGTVSSRHYQTFFILASCAQPVSILRSQGPDSKIATGSQPLQYPPRLMKRSMINVQYRRGIVHAIIMHTTQWRRRIMRSFN